MFNVSVLAQGFGLLVFVLMGTFGVAKAETADHQRKEILREFRRISKECDEGFGQCLENGGDDDDAADDRCTSRVANCHETALTGKKFDMKEVKKCVEDKKIAIQALKNIKPKRVCAAKKEGEERKACIREARAQKKSQREQIRSNFNSCLNSVM